MPEKKLNLKKNTQARIDLDRAGYSLSTTERLKFQVAHAQARDAVHAPWNADQLKEELLEQEYESLILNTMVSSRHEFLMNPHLGRFLNQPSQEILKKLKGKFDIVFCVSDGLSALAIQNHFLKFLSEFYPQIIKFQYQIAPIMLVPYGRVAVANNIGEILNAKLSCIFIGERPGLSSHDSMGVYLTYEPLVFKKDSDSNCLSNIHPPHGLSYEEGGQNLIYLIRESLKRGYSGVNLKLESLPMVSMDINNKLLK